MPDELRHRIVTRVLTDPRTVVVGLDEQGFRVGLPASIPLPPERTIEVPSDRRPMVELVLPTEAIAMVRAWERAAERGVAIATVHARTAPEQALSLTFVDARAEHGVWLGALVTVEEPAAGADAGPIGRLDAPARPRTGVVHKNHLGVLTSVDDRVPRMLGFPASALIGVRSTEFIHPDDRERAVSNWLETLSTGNPQRVRLRYRCADGAWLWVELENEVVTTGPAAAALDVSCVLSDISDEMAAHEELADRERLLHRLTEALPIGMVRIEPEGTISYANSRVAAIFGTPTRATAAEQLELIAERDRPAVRDALAAVSATGTDQAVEVTVRRPDTGAVRLCVLTLVPLDERTGGTGAFGYIQDITESAQLREQLRIRATFDALTGCHNRASILSLLDDALRRAPESTWVLFLDLDGFKAVNDTLGHATGDEVLVHVAGELRSIVRGDDAVGRLGGDEFLVVLTGLDEPGQAAAVADRVSMVLDRTIDIAGSPVQLGASIGVARGEHTDTGATLTARADAAMYEAKVRRRAAGPDAWWGFAGVR